MRTVCFAAIPGTVRCGPVCIIIANWENEEMRRGKDRDGDTETGRQERQGWTENDGAGTGQEFDTAGEFIL